MAQLFREISYRNALRSAAAFLIILGVLVTSRAFFEPAGASAQTTSGESFRALANRDVTARPLAGRRQASLEERLIFGLQARRPADLRFVEAVADTVDRRELPQSLVDRTFFWARSRTPQQNGEFLRRPFIYFRPALEIQARRLRINIRKTPAPASGS